MPSPMDLHPGEREYPRLLFVASLLLCAICAACGAVGSGSPPPPPQAVMITVTPNSAQAFPGAKVQFHAVVGNSPNSGVNWLVNGMSPGNADVGLIDSTGLYVAPNTVPSSGTLMVTAVSQADSTKSASAIVTIQGALSISPAHSSFSTPQPVQLNAAGIDNSALNWAVDNVAGGNSTVGTVLDGLYTPPSLTGSHRITATLVANASVSGSATVDITGFQGTLTWRNDNARSGINGQELALSPATVNPNTFGILFRCPVDGYVYAQPLNIANLPMLGIGTHNVVIVATENDSIYAFDADADSCKQLWKTSLAPAGTQAIDTRSFQINNKWYISPTVGITGTPVIGGLIPTLYVVAASQSGAPGSTYSQQLYALDLTTVPPEIQPAGIGITAPAGQAPGFAQPLGIQRPALLLDHGTVYVAFGSNGGSIEYHGWLFGYDTSSLQQTGAFNVTQPPATQGGIWQSGGGPSADPNDPNHYIFVTTGDGPFNADRTMYSFSYSDSFLRLGTVGGLSVSDYFTPCDQATLETEGLDVGASAPVLLPDAAGSSPQSHLLIGGSKAGSLYVVNRDNMGKFTPSPPPPPQCSDSPVGVQTIPVGTGPILSTPLFWDKAVYVAPGNGHLMSFPMSGGILASSPSASQSPEKTLGPQGATPVISWNGTDNNTAILWLIDTSAAQTWPTASGRAILRAYDPNNLSNEIYSSPTDPSSPNTAGPAVKFTVPTVANGKVYVGTQTELDVYGLLQ